MHPVRSQMRRQITVRARKICSRFTLRICVRATLSNLCDRTIQVLMSKTLPGLQGDFGRNSRVFPKVDWDVSRAPLGRVPDRFRTLDEHSEKHTIPHQCCWSQDRSSCRRQRQHYIHNVVPTITSHEEMFPIIIRVVGVMYPWRGENVRTVLLYHLPALVCSVD